MSERETFNKEKNSKFYPLYLFMFPGFKLPLVLAEIYNRLVLDSSAKNIEHIKL